MTAIRNHLEDVHTASWGTVLSYDAASQKADVQIIPRRGYTDEEGNRQSERPAPLLGVPVVFPGSGDYTITFPVKAGDVVLLVFLEHAMDGWHAGGSDDHDQGDDRRHSLSDAVAIPGLRNSNRKIPGPPPGDAMVLTAPDQIRLGSKDASKGVARNGDPIGVSLSALQTSLDMRYALANPSTPTPLSTAVTGTITSGSSKVKADD